MDRFVPVSFISSLETETERILHASVQTATGFYISKRFAVLPYFVPYELGTIYLPRLNYESVPDFWTDVKKVTMKSGQALLPLHISADFFTSVMPIVAPVVEDLSEDIRRLENDWSRYAPKIWGFLKVVMPYTIANISLIEVRVTSFGSSASFSRVSDKPAKIICYLRREMGIANIFKGIMNGVLAPENKHIGLPWEGMMSVTDYFIYRMIQMELLPPTKLTMKSLLDLDPKLFEESKKYMRELGLALEQPFALNNGQIIFKNKKITSEFSDKQIRILKLLIKRSNELVTNDQIADVLWVEDEEAFSAQAITKQLQRLRVKLDSLGIDSSSIEVVKGTGYLLHNVIM